ncbi:MAG: DUF4145 domain-containing protein [Pseudomonadota bacterium]
MSNPPSFGSIRFSCPHCGALAHQHWYVARAAELEKDATPVRYDREAIEKSKDEQLRKPEEERFRDMYFFDELIRSTDSDVFLSKEQKDPYTFRLYNLEFSRCDSCGDVAVWLSDKLVFPRTGPSGIATSDMPHKIRGLYDEAAAVFATSPRAAAALLRLALQHLLMELGCKGANINADINFLIDRGLDEEIAKPMHVLRIVGNESVHPGQIDVDDEPFIAEALFDLLNQIVEQMITKPRKREELWQKLPESKRKEVEERLKKRGSKS